MNRLEFTQGYERLCRGHRFEATEERAEATYRTVGHWSARAWEEAVDVLLVEPRMPDRNRLIAAVDAASDRIRISERPEPYLPARFPPSPNRDYGQARLDLAKALFRGKITKRDLADRLLDLADRFPAMADTLVREAAWFADQAATREAEILAAAEAAGCRVREDSPSSHAIAPAEPGAPLIAPQRP